MKLAFATGLVVCLSAAVGHAQDAQNPLSGRIWGVAEEQFVSFEDMRTSLTEAQFILIGERHGRKAHQGRQAFIVKALAEAGSYPTVAFEMLDHTQTEIVETYRASAPEYALGLGIDLNWADSNWPSWSFYAPVFDAAFTTKAKIVGADLDDAAQKAAMEGQYDPAHSAKNEPSLQYYSDHMKAAHCDLITQDRADALAQLQLARDTQMASALTEYADDQHGAILMVGSAHVRKSVGVPTHLPARHTRVVTLFETTATTEEFLTPFQDIVPQPLADFDYIWFTPKLEKTSLCNRLKPAEQRD